MGTAVQRPSIVFLLLACAVVAMAAIVSLLIEDLKEGAGSEMAADLSAVRAVDLSEFAALPSTEYAGLVVGLIDARVVPDNQADVPIVVVDVAITNSTTQQTRLPRSMFRLIRPDGGVIDATRFEHGQYGDRLLVPGGVSERALVVFYLPPWADVDLGDYRLEFGSSGRRPTEIPLDGTEPVIIEPRLLTSSSSLPSGLGSGLAGPAIPDPEALPLMSATTHVEFGTYRARTGQEVAAVTFDLSGRSPSAVAALRAQDAWRLAATLPDREEPQVSEPTEVIFVDGGASEAPLLTVIGAYPLEASDLTISTEIDGELTVVASFSVPQLG
jgi:hypothetical protein